LFGRNRAGIALIQIRTEHSKYGQYFKWLHPISFSLRIVDHSAVIQILENPLEKKRKLVVGVFLREVQKHTNNK